MGSKLNDNEGYEEDKSEELEFLKIWGYKGVLFNLCNNIIELDKVYECNLFDTHDFIMYKRQIEILKMKKEQEHVINSSKF